MKTKLRGRFWIEIGVALASTVLLLVTVLWKDWIELVFGVDPDNSRGAFEWLIVAASFAIAIAFFAFARYEWRKAAMLPA